MKKAIIFIVLALSVVLLVSCYWVSGLNSGSVRLDLSALASKGLGDRYARIWLVTNDKIYPLAQDEEYVQKLIPGWEEVSVTLEDIPAGQSYRVWLAIVDQEAGRFFTYVWGESGSFEISPGDEVLVTFTTTKLYDSQNKIFCPIADSDGDPTLMNKSLKDVEVFSGIVHATDGAKLYEISSFNWDPWSPSLTLNSIDAPGGQVINSVSTGINDFVSSALVLDTNTDIIPYNGDLGYNPTITANMSSVSILDSASGDYGGGKVVLFRKTDGWGGTYADFDFANPTEWKWLNRSSGKVFDFVVSQDGSGFAYFAAPTGAFRFSGDYLYTTFFEAPPNLDDYIEGFEAPAPILSLGLINPDGEVLLMGTEDGAYEVWTTSGPEVIGTPSLVDGTQGYRILKIATLYDWPNFFPTYAAFLSDAYLFVRDPFAADILMFPLCAGLPGRITGMAWYHLAGTPDYYLVVAGSEGLAYIKFVEPV